MLRLATMLIVTVPTMLALPTARCQDTSSSADKQAQDKIAQIMKILDDTRVEAKEFRKEMSLVEFLAAIEAKLPKEKKIRLRIDEAAFGKDLPAVKNLRVQLPSNVHPSLVGGLLQELISQANKKSKIDFAVNPTGMLLTRPEFAAHTIAYDVHDILAEGPI